MPNKAKTSNVYYSFDIGPAHIIAFSSEVYFWQLWDIEAQFAFLKKDLAAVNRTKVGRREGGGVAAVCCNTRVRSAFNTRVRSALSGL